MSYKTYVAGFLFDPHYEHVALIKKERPGWQKGKLNGIGGKIEPGETSEQAMRREFHEETGVYISEADWHLFTCMSGENFSVDFYYAIGNPFAVSTTTDEEVSVYSLNDLASLPTIPNLQWLIPMATTMNQESAARFMVKEVYTGQMEFDFANLCG